MVEWNRHEALQKVCKEKDKMLNSANTQVYNLKREVQILKKRKGSDFVFNSKLDELSDKLVTSQNNNMKLKRDLAMLKKVSTDQSKTINKITNVGEKSLINEAAFFKIRNKELEDQVRNEKRVNQDMYE